MAVPAIFQCVFSSFALASTLRKLRLAYKQHQNFLFVSCSVTAILLLVLLVVGLSQVITAEPPSLVHDAINSVVLVLITGAQQWLQVRYQHRTDLAHTTYSTKVETINKRRDPSQPEYIFRSNLWFTRVCQGLEIALSITTCVLSRSRYIVTSSR